MNSKPTLQRGVVIGSSWRLGYPMLKFDTATGQLVRDPANDTYVSERQPFDALARRSILYFDRLVLPINDILPEGDLVGAEYLQSEGVLQTVEIRLPGRVNNPELLRVVAKTPGFVLGGNVVAHLAAAHVQIFRSLEASEPGDWSFAAIGQGFDMPGDLVAERRGFELEQLLNSNPSPSTPRADLAGHVPLARRVGDWPADLGPGDRPFIDKYVEEVQQMSAAPVPRELNCPL